MKRRAGYVLSVLLLTANTFVAHSSGAFPDTDDSGSSKSATSFVVLPIPLSNPALGSGLVAVGLLLYQPENAGKPWMTGGGALYTDNQSKAAAIFQKAYFSQDEYRVTAFAGYGDFNLKFYGLGDLAGLRDRYVPIEQSGNVTQLEALKRVAPNWYVGPRYRFLSLQSSIRSNRTLPDGVTRLEINREDNVSSLGYVVQYDTRDNEQNPKQGIYAEATAMYASQALGSNRSYNKYNIAFNQYLPVGDKSVVAWRAATCSATSGAPFYDVCLFGTSNDLRGYEAGRYRDRTMAATQVEYRWQFASRWGAVGFVGAGEVAPRFSAMRLDEVLPATGVGLRFLASRDYGLNVSVDYAVGKQSKAVYFYIGEAF